MQPGTQRERPRQQSSRSKCLCAYRDICQARQQQATQTVIGGVPGYLSASPPNRRPQTRIRQPGSTGQVRRDCPAVGRKADECVGTAGKHGTATYCHLSGGHRAMAQTVTVYSRTDIRCTDSYPSVPGISVKLCFGKTIRPPADFISVS